VSKQELEVIAATRKGDLPELMTFLVQRVEEHRVCRPIFGDALLYDSM
jgi:hypothetical protein